MNSSVASESCIKSAIQFLPTAAALLNSRDFSVVAMNQIAIRLLEISEDPVGKSIFVIAPELHEQSIFNALGKVGLEEKYSCEGYIHHNNSRRYAEFCYRLTDAEKILLLINLGGTEKDYEEVKNKNDVAVSIAETAGLGLFDFDLAAHSFRSSVRFAEIFGFPSPVDFEAYVARIHPNDYFILDKAREDIKNGRELHYEVGLALPGSPKWIRVSAQPLFDDHNEQNRWIGCIEDITNETQSFKKVQQSEARFRTLADSMPQLVWIADENGNVTEYNNQLRTFSGATQQSNGFWQWQNMVDPEDLQRTRDAWNFSIKNGITYEIEHRLRKRDGTFRCHLSRAFRRVNEEGKVNWYGTATDIQQVKDAEIAIRESEERFRTMADAIPSIVWALTPEGSHRYLNRFAIEYLGIKPEDVPTLNWHAHIHPDDVESTKQVLNEAIQNRIPYSYEHRLRRHDGKYRWFLSQGAPSYHAGELYAYVGSGIDIHELKLAQELLKRNEEALENVVKERTIELQRSNDDLQQFAHVASHDLKEPVRKIKTFSYKLQDEFGEQLTEKGNILLQKIIHSSDRMFAMIHGILRYSEVSSLNNHFKHIDLNEIVMIVRDELELLVTEKQAKFEYDSLPTVYANGDLIHQLLYNLINNSLKFSQDGKPSLIKITSRPITRDGLPYVQIAIRDNGIGFESEQAEQIFGTFVRLHSKDKYEGSGLGLALCKRIVERYGGTITADGKPGDGATFKFTLPT
jgi:PAS domain S-box-containing protein